MIAKTLSLWKTKKKNSFSFIKVEKKIQPNVLFLKFFHVLIVIFACLILGKNLYVFVFQFGVASIYFSIYKLFSSYFLHEIILFDWDLVEILWNVFLFLDFLLHGDFQEIILLLWNYPDIKVFWRGFKMCFTLYFRDNIYLYNQYLWKKWVVATRR